MLSQYASQHPREVGSVMVILRDGDAGMLSSLCIKKHESSDRALWTLTPDHYLLTILTS